MYVGRPRDTIRDQLLALWSAQYAGLVPPQRLLVAPGSDAYLWATALAVMLEGLEAQAEQTARDILPDQASEEALARHADVDGVPRRPGTVARHSVTVTNAADGSKSIPVGSQMSAIDGTLYRVEDASVAIAAGTGTQRAAGTARNSAKPPCPTKLATRWPTATPSAPGPRAATVPQISMPGVSGTGGFS